MESVVRLYQADFIVWSLLVEQALLCNFTCYCQAVPDLQTKYAKESPREFVVEVYAGMCDGNKYSDEVMALYRKYGGPELN